MGNEPKTIYKHTLFINVNNRVLNHRIEEMKDGIKPGTDDAYIVTYNKSTEIFSIIYYSYDNGKYSVENYIVDTFRHQCNKVTNGIKTVLIAE